MRDPIEQLDELRTMDVNPLPPEEVRLRGNRIRRRRVALTVAGAAAVVVVIVAPIALLTNSSDRAAPPPPATEVPSEVVKPTNTPSPSATASSSSITDLLDDSHLMTVDQLPALPQKWTWQLVESQPTPTLACQGAWMSSLAPQETVSREFRSRTGRSSQYDVAMVNTAVLSFTDMGAADAAYNTALAWLHDCPATHTTFGRPDFSKQVAPVDVATSPDVASVDRAHQVRVTYLPDEFCPDGCDASYFDLQTIAQVGTRLVFVTHSELAGPCPPGSTTGEESCNGTEADYQPLTERATVTVENAVGRAIWDLH